MQHPHPLKTARLVRGLGIRDVATKAGVSIETVRAWENGICAPTSDQLKFLCELYDWPCVIFDKPLTSLPAGWQASSGQGDHQ